MLRQTRLARNDKDIHALNTGVLFSFVSSVFTEDDLNEELEEYIYALQSWLTTNVETTPPNARLYGARFVKEGVASINRLVKRVRQMNLNVMDTMLPS